MKAKRADRRKQTGTECSGFLHAGITGHLHINLHINDGADAAFPVSSVEVYPDMLAHAELVVRLLEVTEM